MFGKMLKTLVINGTPRKRSYINNTTEAKGYLNENTFCHNVF